MSSCHNVQPGPEGETASFLGCSEYTADQWQEAGSCACQEAIILADNEGAAIETVIPPWL